MKREVLEDGSLGYWNWFHDWTDEEKNEAWFYCLHCGKFFKGKEAVPERVGGLVYFSCPNECDGTPIDWISLEELRYEMEGVPEVPERGRVYDLNEYRYKDEQTASVNRVSEHTKTTHLKS